MVRNLQSDVEHLHFVVTRSDRAVLADGGNNERVHRLTQYVPCETEHDLRVLERKLLDHEFSRRSVSCFVYLCFVLRHDVSFGFSGFVSID